MSAECGACRRESHEAHPCKCGVPVCLSCFLRHDSRGCAPPAESRARASMVERVRAWLPKVQAFERECRRLGKTRTSVAGAPISMEDRDLAQALECATAEALGSEPNLGVWRGEDGGRDGVARRGPFAGQSFDVKSTIVHTSWTGPQGWNEISAADGRVRAEVIVCAMATRALTRAEVIGYAPRDAPRYRIAGFDRPAYRRCDLLPLEDL